MFDAFVNFTKNLFNDDQPPQPPPVQRPHVEELRMSRSSVSGGDPFEFVRPQNLWNREDLHLVLSDEKIQNGYDEKFRKGLQKYGGGVNYKPPNINIIRQFMIEMRDLYLIIISQKKNAKNIKDEMDRLAEEFYRQYFPFLTKNVESLEAHVLIVQDVFKLLPRSFKSRDDNELNSLIYKFYTYEKLVVLKMTENRLQDNVSFRKTCSRIDALHSDASIYLNKVIQLRSAVDTTRKSALLIKDTVIKKFNKKMKAQKILYILEKVKSKYQKVIGYCAKDLAETSIFTYGTLYRIFLIALINFKSDAQKFTSLKLLKKFDEIVTKKLVSIKKRIKNEMYSELKSLVANPRARRTEKLGIIVDLHHEIAKISKEVLDKSRIEGKLQKGLELFDDSRLLENNFADIISYNPSLDNDRARELIFGSGSSGGIGETKLLFRGITKPTGDFDGNITPR